MPRLTTSMALLAALSAGNRLQGAVMTSDPCGGTHIPIGIANTVDPLKTFIESSGIFSPGVASYGVYFWSYDEDAEKLVTPTESSCTRGLKDAGKLIPWVEWTGSGIAHRLEICEVERVIEGTPGYVVGARLTIANRASTAKKVGLYAAIRPLGAAGWPIGAMTVLPEKDALLVDGHPALVSTRTAQAAGVVPLDSIGSYAARNTIPDQTTAQSDGTCSGALKFAVDLGAGQTEVFEFICPVLPGRRVQGHDWDGGTGWAQADRARYNPPSGGIVQPDPGVDYYRGLSTNQLFEDADAYWAGLVGKQQITTPDPRWAECFGAIVGHAAVSMNEDAPDVSVVNYNVFNRDGVYTTNILQKSGNFALAARAIDYMLTHPFNGRGYPEADNPGQVLWILGQQWRFTRDKPWLESVYPGVRKLVAMVQYYRTTARPHYVCLTGIDFGPALTCPDRAEFVPGRCDGSNPNYTEAFDLSGVREAVGLARAIGNATDASEWQAFADALFAAYDARYSNLAQGYGSYSVLWPCRLYPFHGARGAATFANVGAQNPSGWRYFPLAKAHQGLYAGNREGGFATLEKHFANEQMQKWYAFDEGGGSWQGNWPTLLTQWNPDVAMPHGWANAEMMLLLRDCLAFEDENQLILLGGVAPEWFKGPSPIQIRNMRTWFGPLDMDYVCHGGYAELRLGTAASPPEGYVLRIPASLGAAVSIDGVAVPKLRAIGGSEDYTIPASATLVMVVSAQIGGNGLGGHASGATGTARAFDLQVKVVSRNIHVRVAGCGGHAVLISDIQGRAVGAFEGTGNQTYRLTGRRRLSAGGYVVRVETADRAHMESRTVTVP